MSRIKDISLANQGIKKILWAYDHMAVLKKLDERFRRERPLLNFSIGMSIHMEAKTARLALLLKELGASVYATGCNPLSTQDDVAAGLTSMGIDVFAIHGASPQEYKENLLEVLDREPDLIIDDGGDLFEAYYNLQDFHKWPIIGGCEETTTGITRLRAYEKLGPLPFPVINVNDAKCKHLYDNVYGTGQSTVNAIMNTTNNTIAGKTIVIAGYGYCGKGIAKRMHGMGGCIIITEIDPVKAIEAKLEGYEVMTMDEAALQGDFFITATGCKDVITDKHFPLMKNNAILCNSGHFDVEINLNDLAAMSSDIRERRDNITGYRLDPSGKVINVLAEGRLVNLAAGNGHPAEIMDTSFALQTLSLLYLVKNQHKLAKKLYDVPDSIDQNVARLKLQTMGVTIDTLTDAQREYLGLGT
ncbi:adenosylhomocysteinase [Candidatus Saccharibacteria bacterium]|nr:adenosylhomocysteinase [Candidatus Saccharibacteria bacterium]